MNISKVFSTMATVLLVSAPVSRAASHARDSIKPVCAGAAGYAASFQGRQTYLWRPQGLMATQSKILDDPNSVPAYVELMIGADKALSAGPWSVTDKTRAAPSRDKHDYASLAPYFWPDLQSANGLPYINKDGLVNPERNGDAFDRSRLESMTSAIENLGLAYYFTNDKKYADRAALILRVWFLDPATRMNPNLNFSQAVPGQSTGRAAGVIDGVQLVGVIEAIGLLQPSGSLTNSNLKGLRAWFRDLSDWMVSSPIGRAEGAATNNHGIYYDLQLSEYALFSGNMARAREVIAEFPAKRISQQFAPDGGLPREQKRTRSFHYSMWTMQAVYDVATIGECIGVDLWSYRDSEGRGVRTSTNFIVGYVGHESLWSWPELSLNPEELYIALLKASYGYDDPKIRAGVAAYSFKYGNAREALISPLLGDQ